MEYRLSKLLMLKFLISCYNNLSVFVRADLQLVMRELCLLLCNLQSLDNNESKQLWVFATADFFPSYVLDELSQGCSYK